MVPASPLFEAQAGRAASELPERRLIVVHIIFSPISPKAGQECGSLPAAPADPALHVSTVPARQSEGVQAASDEQRWNVFAVHTQRCCDRGRVDVAQTSRLTFLYLDLNYKPEEMESLIWTEGSVIKRTKTVMILHRPALGCVFLDTATGRSPLEVEGSTWSTWRGRGLWAFLCRL